MLLFVQQDRISFSDIQVSTQLTDVLLNATLLVFCFVCNHLFSKSLIRTKVLTVSEHNESGFPKTASFVLNRNFKRLSVSLQLLIW